MTRFLSLFPKAVEWGLDTLGALPDVLAMFLGALACILGFFAYVAVCGLLIWAFFAMSVVAGIVMCVLVFAVSAAAFWTFIEY